MKTIKEKQITKKDLWDIVVDVSWANISTRYFGKSRSWLHHKLNGTDSNGGLTKEEQQILKAGLLDLAKRITDCADKI